MAVVTLTTEWRADDFYFGIIRGTLEKLAPGLQVIVNASSIPALNIAQAAFIIRNTFHHYPEGSVHLICIHSETGKRVRTLLVKSHGHFFIGTDNGIFNLILNEKPEIIIALPEGNNADDLISFAQTAAALIGGAEPASLGEPADKIKEMIPLRATIDSNAVNGSIIFIDSYGNAITNITREIFTRIFGKSKFIIYIQSNRHKIDTISTNYNDKPVGDLLARFNNLDLLEVAINGSDVSELFGLEPGSVVRITTDEKPGKGTGLFT